MDTILPPSTFCPVPLAPHGTLHTAYKAARTGARLGGSPNLCRTQVSRAANALRRGAGHCTWAEHRTLSLRPAADCRIALHARIYGSRLGPLRGLVSG